MRELFMCIVFYLHTVNECVDEAMTVTKSVVSVSICISFKDSENGFHSK